MASIIDGKAAAELVRGAVKVRAEAFLQQHGRSPSLHVVLVGDDPASQVYVRNKELAAHKASISGLVHRLPIATTQAQLLTKVQGLSADPAIDGILVQLPLPKHLDEQSIIACLDPQKDVDGLHPYNAGLLMVGRPGLRPCTPSGCMHLIEAAGCDPAGKHAVVIGRSILVGKPIALMLLEKNATVTIAHSKTADLKSVVRQADIVVAAVGRADLVKGSWLKPGAVVIDVGINKKSDGKLCGDVDFAEAMAVAGHVTPVPGGVGPMTIAWLLANTVLAAERRAMS
ncbi:MAG: bifunctional methylenetetrahydrofolate dehydrogenase/methenyltetrahydrofolate cyclohydrolase FolD [Planctomycetota bacterium]|jgi:methylenetetrahydrofolate dehydrogenase (NADP+)/methenyltetrahydrofolate cyclohydrolase|nr:bifunctional methylenetetrahydrofolate dehydrogenase/methenyltetrahydrofolate cyclohydrolase FolD [Planctomycetota bacterium]